MSLCQEKQEQTLPGVWGRVSGGSTAGKFLAVASGLGYSLGREQRKPEKPK